ncbi:MAG TPA: glucosidase, partial [Chitinophagales bacterium]|nr:glucosidase [Chitinophagales bacterium]
FFYDLLKMPEKGSMKLKVRSMVGLIPLFAVEVLDDDLLKEQKGFSGRLKWFLDNRPDLASLVSRWQEKGSGEKHLLSLLRGHRMKRILKRMLDESEFLSDYGIRAISKFHEAHPYEITINGDTFGVKYTPGESDSGLFGGNSNWRGPIWMPVNFLLIESLQRFHHYYGDEFKVEYPTGSGQYFSLNEIADALSKRLANIFLRNQSGERPVFGDNEKFQSDPYFKDHVPFYEYFHGDNGRGVGASHQTGWTGLIAKLLMPKNEEKKNMIEKIIKESSEKIAMKEALN